MRDKSKYRRTKIICTIGPATSSPESIMKLIENGMDVARLNFSHGDRESHRQTIKTIRKASRKAKKEVAILQDLGGPKIRLGRLPVEKRTLEREQRVTLVYAEASEDDSIPVNYPYILEDVDIGQTILMADGTVEMKVLEKGASSLLCRVTAGGDIRSQKGVNLPATNLRITAFTDKDRADLMVGLEERVDFVAMSFVRSERDLAPVLHMLESCDRRPLLIAKIEKPQAVNNIAEILAKVDGVMVARGDLGVEMPLEDVPIIQKDIISLTRRAAKPVITATQMLTSMLENPRPTRAESTDVANAILDGTDALMLSDETAVGAYPFEAVSMLDRIARTTEPYIPAHTLLNEPFSEFLPTTAAAISRAACWLATDLNASAIVATSSSGSTARLVARFRPPCPIIGLTDRVETTRQLALSSGVLPQRVESFSSSDDMFTMARALVIQQGIAKPGDRIIITAGVPVGMSGTTNLLKVMEID